MTLKKHHRRVSSYWTPASFPIVGPLPSVSGLWQRRNPEHTRLIIPNPAEDCSRYQLPNYIKYKDNAISTTKYNPLTFIPRNLWEQFHRLANIYFVFIICIDCVPMWNTTPVFLSAMPVVFIIALTAVKDGLEDMRRRRLDSKVNNATCHVWDKNANRFRKMKWKLMLVGDIVHISNNEQIPADILLLRSSSTDGNAFVETSNLDGESNLKHKIVPSVFHDYCNEELDALDDTFLQLKIASAPPSKDVKDMRGSFEMDGKSESFSPENTLLRGCRLKNTTFVEGIVIYAGHDTKVMLSSGRAPYKRSHAEVLTNKFVIGCACMLAIIIVITMLGRHIWASRYFENNVPGFAQPVANPDWLSTLGSGLVLYQIMIPLALYITVEIIKLGQVFFMQQDVKMYSEDKDEPFVARSLSMGEELGQLTHLLSDKTGTLTQNKMILRRVATVNSECAVGLTSCTAPDKDMDFRHVLNTMIACNTVFVQYERRRDNIEDQDTPQVSDVYSVCAPSSYAFSESDLADEELKLRGLGAPIYEGESPDELALVKGAGKFGYYLSDRSAKYVTCEGPDGKSSSFKVLCTLPFDNVRKRMSVCVVGARPDEVIVYSKGADSAMLEDVGKRVKRSSQSALRSIEEEDEESHDDRPRLHSRSREEIIKDRVDDYARLGLRTLVIGMRVMKRAEFEEWHRVQKQLELLRRGGCDEETEKLLRQQAEKIERPTRVIGVTAVEDKLQEGVEKSIAALREAKIQVWVLTGDMQLTAEGVATACGLFSDVPVDFESNSEETYKGEDVVVAPDQVTELCDPHSSALDRLDGCLSVLCYRLDPSQKAEIVKAVKRRGGVVAAIGDGANDVPMIQAAHVGIGISGHEGAQASMAADFVLAQFSFVSRLILLHGHWNYARIANVMLYFFYKNIQNVMTNFFIQTFNGWSCGFPIDSTYSMLYPVIFTSLQPIIFGVMEQDYQEKDLLTDSSLYEDGRNGNLYNVKQFILTIADSVWQAAACYFMVHAIIIDSPHATQYLGFCISSTEFTINNLHLILETRSLSVVMIFVQLAGCVVSVGYFLIFDLLPTEELHIAYDAMGQFSFYAAVLLAAIVALTPRFLIRVLLASDSQAYKQENKDCTEMTVL